MTNTERQAWQRQQVGTGPCVLLPGQYVLLRGQTPDERRTTLRLLRQYRSIARDTTPTRNN